MVRSYKIANAEFKKLSKFILVGLSGILNEPPNRLIPRSVYMNINKNSNKRI